MKKSIVWRLAVALTLTTASIYMFAPWEFLLFYMRPLPATVQAQADEATAAGIDGILIYVDDGHGAPRTYASGWHDRATQLPADPKALFKIASIAKLYVASAITKLHTAGVVSVDKTLADYMPELKGRIEHADQITLAMMVQHRSGIPNFTDQDGFDWSNTQIDALGLVLDKPADFAPGTDYAYSNTNYLLLRRIMDQQLGYSHWRYIQTHILQPLGLQDTYFSVHDVDPDRLMGGYHVGFEQNFKTLDQGMVATIEDVGVFLRALNEGRFFTPEERTLYARLYKLNHEGWVLGHSSRAYYHPDIDTVVVQFVSTTGNDTVLLTGFIYDRVMRIIRAG